MSMAPARVTLGDVATRFGLDLRGDANVSIDGVGTLEAATASELSFFTNPRYRSALAHTRAAAVVLDAEAAATAPGAALISTRPYADFARIAALFERRTEYAAGIHPSAVIATDASVDPTTLVGAQVVVGARSRIGPRVVLGAGTIVGEDCAIDADCVLVARVTLVRDVRMGQRVRVHPGAVIGADGFGNAYEDGHWIKVPQLGGVVIGDDCEIGANTCIDRGALGDTVLEEDVRLDNLVQIGHNVHIGAHTAMAGCVGVAGSARIGRHCLIAGQAGIGGHIEICDHVTVTAASALTHSIHQPGVYSGGLPVSPNTEWRRNAARFARLDATLRKLLRPARNPDVPSAARTESPAE